MSEQSPVVPSPPPFDVTKKIAVQISYCPILGLYHWLREDGEYFFNNVQMETIINAFLADGKYADAEHMGKTTALERAFPHKIYTVFVDNTFDVRPPDPQPQYHEKFEDSLQDVAKPKGG